MWEDNKGWTFFFGGSVYMDWYFGQKGRFKVFKMPKWLICVLQTCNVLQHKTLIEHLESCGLLVMFFISCLDSYSYGTHSLHMIHWWASDAMLNSPNMFWWRNKFIYILDGLWVSTFSANFLFWMNYSFNPKAQYNAGKTPVKQFSNSVIIILIMIKSFS